MTKGTPANISQLVKDANNKSSWKIRLAALNELEPVDTILATRRRTRFERTTGR